MYKIMVLYGGHEHGVYVTATVKELFWLVWSLNNSDFVQAICIENGMMPSDFGWGDMAKVVKTLKGVK